MHHSLFSDVIGWLDCQKSYFCRELVWGCVCEESNVKDAYFHIRDSFFEFMAGMAVLSVAVCCASAYISRVGSVRVWEMTVGRRSSSVRTNTGSEGYQAENLGPIPPLLDIKKWTSLTATDTGSLTVNTSQRRKVVTKAPAECGT